MASAEHARQLQQQGVIVLDVREDPEWRAGHAPGVRHIPLSRLPGLIKDLPPRRTVITVCRSGHRSARAAALLAGEGREAASLSGGMHAWARAGLPVVALGGHPAGWRER